MGTRIRLPVTFTDPTLPKNRADPLLADGSLLLLDFSRAAVIGPGTIPGNEAALGNLAFEIAAEVLGGGSENTLAAIFENTLVGQPSMGIVERSTRSGIHIITSQANMDSSARHGGIRFPDAVTAYVRANLPAHTFYCSIWGRQTRLATASANGIGYLGDTSNANNCGWSFYTQPSRAPADNSSAFVGALADPTVNSTGNFFRSIAVDDWTGTKPSAPNTVGKFWFGAQGPYLGFQRNGAASGVIYRIYLEDLTVSNRPASAVIAADKALYDAAFAPGGKFYGDTVSDPSTVP